MNTCKDSGEAHFAISGSKSIEDDAGKFPRKKSGKKQVGVCELWERGVDEAGGTREQPGDGRPQGPVSARGRSGEERLPGSEPEFRSEAQVRGPLSRLHVLREQPTVSGTVRAQRTYTGGHLYNQTPGDSVGSERIPQPKYLCPHL